MRQATVAHDGADAYYLSAYVTPPGDRSVISPRHDHNVALWRRSGQTVELVRYWELERFSGQKHHSWPLYTGDRSEGFLAALLATERLDLTDITASWGTPGLPGYRTLAMPAGAEEFPVHSLAHLFSGMLLDSRIFKTEKIIGLAVDAAPDLVLETKPPSAWYAGCVSDRGRLAFTPVESPAPLYHAADRLFGKEPGTLMARASASRTEIRFDARAAVARQEFLGGRVPPWPAAFRIVNSIIAAAQQQLTDEDLDNRFSREENLQSAVMKVIQRCCEVIMVRNIATLCAASDVRTQDCYLSLSGGFALNCPTNTLLVDRFGFRGLLIPPCANDSGQSLGLGLLGLYGAGVFDAADVRIGSAYHGADLADTDAALSEFAPWILDMEDFSGAQFAEDVADGVVAWVDGAAEMGPRALGHRSLLGDPRSAKVKDLLNEVKGRQWWRPVAPLVLADDVGEWFEETRPSPFMLEATRVRQHVRDLVPAIVHLDGSARHQTLTRAENPLLYRAVEAFRSATGVPMLCNTSLNDKGEPIANTVAEALNFCVRKGIRVAYIAGRRVSMLGEPPGSAPVPAGPRPRAAEHFAGQEASRDSIWRSWLERGYTEASLLILTGSPQLLADPVTFTPRRVNILARRLAASDDAFTRNLDEFRAEHGPGAKFIGEPGQMPRRAAASA
jgi:carbamoyltransferase